MINTIVEHKVKIGREGNHAIATPKYLGDVNKGDTLQISSADGKFRVVFRPWPFGKKRKRLE